MNVEELKEKARHHELREEWQKAFDFYSQALRHQDDDESPDITLHNRVGDIQTRLGRIDGAVEQYEKAIDLYLEAELPNNAIAICKKVLRNLPDRIQFFLRMGQIRANQGFLTDARQSFLTYAERQTALGNVESALNALVEFVELSPNDLEIRRSLASQLEAHGRTEEAVEQYLDIYRRLAKEEEDEEAAQVAETLKRLSPELVLPDTAEIREGARMEPGGEAGIESDSFTGTDAWEDEEEQDAPSQELVIESTNLGGLELDEPGGEQDVDGDLILESSPGAGLETADEDEEDEVTLPSFSFESEEGGEEGEVIPVFGFDDSDSSHEVNEGELEGMDELPFISFGEEDDESQRRPAGASPEGESDEDGLSELPFLSLGQDEGDQVESDQAEGDEGSWDQAEGEETDWDETGVSAETPVEVEEEEKEPEGAWEGARGDQDREEAIEEASGEAWESAEEMDEAGIGVQEGERAEGLEAEGHAEAADRGDLDLAMERVGSLLQERPDDVDLHQRLVEYAFRTGDSATLVEAYLKLGRCLSRTGAPLKAKAVFRQVLSLVPDHPQAQEELAGLTEGSPEGAPREVASSEDYVDLGSLILDEVEGETTRWKVAADAPSGDEEADFAKMLGQFKEKVSEHVAADDVTAHHDLGTAYMEMGLLEEAIGEFQKALRADSGHLPTHEVMGRCWMEAGNPGMTIRALERALNVASGVEDEFIGIYYLLGRAHEELGNRDDAVEFFEKVFSLDINFEDVTERLRALR